MSVCTRLRRRASVWATALFILSQLAGLLVMPRPASAAISADPADEIVYIDGEGYIRILDPDVGPLDGWKSPDNNWRYLSLGDFNNDTDLEIVAMGQEGDFVKVTVFDPVVAKGGSQRGGKYGPQQIPWDIYYETRLPAIAKFVEAGNFDNNVPGDEIMIGFRDPAQRHYVRVWKAAGLDPSGNPTGRAWEQHIAKDYAERYSFADSGQFNGEGADEAVLVDEDSTLSRFDIFQVDADFDRLDGKTSDSDKYRQVAVGQIIEGGRDEIAVILSVDRASKESLIIYEYDEKEAELVSDEDWRWAFAPQPEYVFLADLSGNGDEEVLFLRDHPDENGARLIMRDDWGDDRDRHPEIEEDLDGVEYTAGAGGDIDGDGMDEIILMRDEGFLIFMSPQRTLESNTRVEHQLSTDGDTLVVGDLDTIGFVEGAQFAADKSKIEASVPTGTRSGEYTVRITSTVADTPITFSASIGSVPWASLDRTVATTPATLTLRFDATNLTPGLYTTSLRLDAQTANVLNTPLLIAVELTVQPATLNPQPNLALYAHYPCAAPLAPVTTTIKLAGTNDLNFRAAVIGVPAETALASTGWGGLVTGGEIDSAGNMVLYDAQGNRRTIPMSVPPSDAVSAAATLSATWPVDPTINWITGVSSDATSVPATINIQLDPTVLGPNFPTTYAVMVLVADTRAGAPPENVEVVPIMAMCSNGRLSLPLIP
ncbi:MAG TPA: hypothetical protein VNK95_06590 [Caldilineaceae bacterium]|nr:hypothetical protein [Caldilineaceae bacterium]